MKNNLDHLLAEKVSEHPNIALVWYLGASYLYYHHDISILSDTLYDELCQYILNNWDDIDHPHKYLVDKDSLRAGTGFSIKEEEYPSIVKSSALRMVKLLES